jgi:DNA-binding NarL/FixJ family response regulator
VASQTAVILDKHPLWLEAVEQVLARVDVEVVGKATTPTRALELVDALTPELFVTGVHMGEGEMDGITCISRARERSPELRAVVLSSETSTDYIDRALEVGAVAYVFKSAYPDDLASAIRQVFGNSVYFVGTRQGTATRHQAVTRPETDLTKRELEILQLVAEGYTNANLAKQLWVTEQTIKFHLSNVYRKLDVSNRTEAARWAQVHGLLGEPTSGSPLELARLAAS